MKKVLKYFGIGIILLFAVSVILGNIGNFIVSKKQKDYVHSLEGMLAEINRSLHNRTIDGFDYFIIDKVVQEEDKIVWEIILDTTLFYPTRESFLPEALNGGVLPKGKRNMSIDLDTSLSSNLLKQSQQLNLLYYNLFAKTDNPNPFLEEIMKRKYSQAWRIKSPFGNRQCEFSLTYEKMKETENLCKKQPEIALELFTSEYVKRQNRLLNLANGNADIKMNMIDDGDTLVICCKFDKSYSQRGNRPIANLRRQKGEIQMAIEEDIRTLPIFFNTKNICKKINKGFLFRYIDWNKTDSLDFIIF